MPKRNHITLTIDVPPDGSRTVEFTTLTWMGVADRYAFERHFHQPLDVLIDDTVKDREPHVGTLFLLWRVVRRQVPEFTEITLEAFAELLIDFDVEEVEAAVDPPAPAPSLA